MKPLAVERRRLVCAEREALIFLPYDLILLAGWRWDKDVRVPNIKFATLSTWIRTSDVKIQLTMVVRSVKCFLLQLAVACNRVPNSRVIRLLIVIFGSFTARSF